MKQRILFTLVLFLAVANLLVWGFLGIERAYADKVYPGVWIQTQPLAGLTRDQVIDKLKPVEATMLKQKVTLILADKQYHPTLADLGYNVDIEKMADEALALGRGPNVSQVVHSVLDYQKSKTIPISYTIDQGHFDSYLNDIGKDVIKEPKNIGFEFKDNQLVMTPAEDGIGLDKEELRQAIQKEVKPGETAHITLNYSKATPIINDDTQVEDAKTQLSQLLAKPLTIQAEEINDSISPDTIYSFIYYDVKDSKLTINFDKDKVTAAVSKLAKKVDIAPVPQQVNESDKAIISEGKDGRQLDVPDASKRIFERLTSADFESPLVLKVNKVDRKVTTISPEYQLGRFPGRYIEVDLSAQRMFLLEGDSYHKTFIVSTGKWDKPTPLGTFYVQNHVQVAWSRTYKLYMPKWMGITTDGGYGIHQLPQWPDGRVEGTSHLGRPVSHGCIRLGPGDSDYVYDWAPNGTPVVIHQ